MCVYIHFIPNNLWISITGMHFMSVLYFRAEKSEVLSEDLQTVEKRVELVKTVCQSTSKKIAGCLQGQGTDYEKRLVQCDCYLELKLDTPLISGPHVRLWYFFVIVEKVTWEYSWSWDDRKWYSTWHRLRYGVSDCSVLQWCIYEHLELCSWKNIVYWTTFKCCKTESVHILSVWWHLGAFSSRTMFQTCGECQTTLAKELLQFEVDVEQNVLAPLQEILDVSIYEFVRISCNLSRPKCFYIYMAVKEQRMLKDNKLKIVY